MSKKHEDIMREYDDRAADVAERLAHETADLIRTHLTAPLLAELATANARIAELEASIVRCGECKHIHPVGKPPYHICGITGCQIDKDWFCNHGEREKK